MARTKYDEQTVLRMRELYYVDSLSFFKIGKMYNTNASTIRKAIFGMGGYRDIKDTIPKQVKEKRAEKERKMYGIETT